MLNLVNIGKSLVRAGKAKVTKVKEPKAKKTTVKETKEKIKKGKRPVPIKSVMKKPTVRKRILLPCLSDRKIVRPSLSIFRIKTILFPHRDLVRKSVETEVLEAQSRVSEIIDDIVEEVNRVDETDVTSKLVKTGQNTETDQVGSINEADKSAERNEEENIIVEQPPVHEGGHTRKDSTCIINEETIPTAPTGSQEKAADTTIPDSVETLDSRMADAEAEKIVNNVLKTVEERAYALSDSYYKWAKARLKVNFKDMLPECLEESKWSTLVSLEEYVLDLAKTSSILVAMTRTNLVEANSILRVLLLVIDKGEDDVIQGEVADVNKIVLKTLKTIKENLIAEISIYEETTGIDEEPPKSTPVEEEDEGAPSQPAQPESPIKSPEDKEENQDGVTTSRSTNKSAKSSSDSLPLVQHQMVDSGVPISEERMRSIMEEMIQNFMAPWQASIEAKVNEIFKDWASYTDSKLAHVEEVTSQTLSSVQIISSQMYELIKNQEVANEERIRADEETVWLFQADEDEKAKAAERDNEQAARKFQHELMQEQIDEERQKSPSSVAKKTRAQTNKRKSAQESTIAARTDPPIVNPAAGSANLNREEKEEEEDDEPLNQKKRKSSVTIQPIPAVPIQSIPSSARSDQGTRRDSVDNVVQSQRNPAFHIPV
ncbi:neurofilament medium polypeptide-like [Impatiens glandulifera]|uniref:neurofilament medium polypeptide-like n=1 Tax=Impatiens glandulifera TaxID=253017 RepID=UPI001FB0CE11|nr:neurofilament medium polypeptide-like [Impatiens glandulifera]